ncbi:hypothetical protein JW899_04765 [Candidatus Uhrbacteria bacterium]|nr:hypothetical protein [Candidatus Uhrbacteria bacterium]
MAKHVDQGLKRQVLGAVKNGMRVAEAKLEFGVSDNAIYGWLRAQADNSGTSALEMARLRRGRTPTSGR